MSKLAPCHSTDECPVPKLDIRKAGLDTDRYLIFVATGALLPFRRGQGISQHKSDGTCRSLAGCMKVGQVVIGRQSEPRRRRIERHSRRRPLSRLELDWVRPRWQMVDVAIVIGGSWAQLEIERFGLVSKQV